MGARNRVGIGYFLSYRPVRLHRLSASIPGLLESLKIPSLNKRTMRGTTAEDFSLGCIMYVLVLCISGGGGVENR